MLVLLTGGTPTRSLDVTAPEARNAVNAPVEARPAQIVFNSDETLNARSIVLAPDTIRWVARHDDKTGTAPLSEIRSIQSTNRRRGGLEGAGLGFVMGAVLGAAVAGGQGEGVAVMSGGAAAALGATVLGLLGAPIGGLVGLVQGSRIVYELHPARPSDSPPTVVADSTSG